MREKLRNDLLVLMDDYLEPDKLREVVPMLESILSNYEIKKRETEIIVYGSDIPETVKTYIVAKKISGLSDKSLYLYTIVLRDFFIIVNKDYKDISPNLINSTTA